MRIFGLEDGGATFADLTQPRRARDRLERFFRERYTVLDRGEMAGIPCWELRPKP